MCSSTRVACSSSSALGAPCTAVCESSWRSTGDSAHQRQSLARSYRLRSSRSTSSWVSDWLSRRPALSTVSYRSRMDWVNTTFVRAPVSPIWSSTDLSRLEPPRCPAVMTWPFQTTRRMASAALMMSYSGGQKLLACPSRPCATSWGRLSMQRMILVPKACSIGIMTWPFQPSGPG